MSVALALVQTAPTRADTFAAYLGCYLERVTASSLVSYRADFVPNGMVVRDLIIAADQLNRSGNRVFVATDGNRVWADIVGKTTDVSGWYDDPGTQILAQPAW